MIRINQIKISAKIKSEQHLFEIQKYISKLLKIKEQDISSITIFKKSIDARKSPDIYYVYTVDIETKNSIKKLPNNKDISIVDPVNYSFPYFAKDIKYSDSPIIVGLGPAGLFAGYILAKYGFKPLILERGKPVDERSEDVKNFWENGILNPNSNIQFGAGGAGTFSDGKLNTLVKDKSGRNREVLKILTEFGAPAEILYDNKPHIGTDILKTVVNNICDYITENGGVIKYNSCVDNILTENNRITAVGVGNKEYKCNNLILAIGHSSRDTFELLNKLKIDMSPKAFAVGFRVMHPQAIIDENQYGEGYEAFDLPGANYKVTSNNERGVYSFCMCPGGYVVNASSEEGKLAVNGMSYHDRASGIANSAIIVQVTPEDFESNDILGGMYWQQKLEENAYKAGQGTIPIEKYGDFRKNINPDIESTSVLKFEPAIKGKYSYADLSKILPLSINKNFVTGMEEFGRKIKYFNDQNVIMAGIESRTSSPVRINRDGFGESISVKGLYPCGEGAGYAGGITSAAMDGLYIAEMVAKNILNQE